MSDRSKGITFALISVSLYSLIPVFGKVAVAEFPPIFVAFIVSLFAGIWLGGISIIRKEFSLKLIDKKNAWLVLLGVFASLGSLFSFTGLSIGRAIDAGFFFQFGIFFTPILAFLFLKEKLSTLQIAGLLAMFFGTLFFTGFNINVFDKSIPLFLAAALAWSISGIIVRSKRDSISPFVMAFARNIFSSFFLFFFAYSYFANVLPKLSLQNIVYFALYGAVVAGIVLFAYLALKHLKAGEAVSFNVLTPLITFSVAFFALGESLMGEQIIGGAIILIGLLLIMKRQFNKFDI